MSSDTLKGIVLKDFSLTYKAKLDVSSEHRIWQLGPLNLQIEQGEKIVVLGDSGSGKTSFLSCVQYYGEGSEIHTLRSAEVSGAIINESNLNIMTVFQESKSAFNPLKTVQHLFKDLYHSQKFPFDKSFDRKEIMRYLEMTGLENPQSILKKHPDQLSGGMAQRVMIAMVLSMQPDVILADEVTSAVDKVNEKIVLDILLSHVDTLIMVTHRLHIINELFSRIIFLEEGKIVFDGTYDAFMSSDLLCIREYIENINLVQEEDRQAKNNKHILGDGECSHE